jgi:hypothetical protein
MGVIRAILGAIIAAALLYMADQEFADGKYTDTASKIVRQIRHKIGL